MKPILYLILSCLLLTGCVKAGVTPTSPKSNTSIVKADTSKSITTTIKADTAAYDWYNGTKGTALIQVACNDCSAIATIGNVSTPFLFNAQGIGQLKYTPVPGLAVYIAVCPGSVKTITATIFDAANTSLYTYTGVSGNWNTTYIIK